VGAGVGELAVVSSSAIDPGVIMLATVSVVGAVSNKEGYRSPGADKKDSAGDASNLTWGVDAAVPDGLSPQLAILIK
jgi:hypothetical protein